jgi:hypothetical protein
MKTAVYGDYKPTRELGKWFLHGDITGEMWFGVGWMFFSELFINFVKQIIRHMDG